MDVGGVAADVVVKEGVELTGEALKLAGEGLKNVAALLLAIKHEHYKLVGKTNAKTLAKDPSPAVVAPLKIEDKGKFQKLARSFGLLYFIPRKKGDISPVLNVVSNEANAAKLNAVFQAMGYPLPAREKPGGALKKSHPLRSTRAILARAREWLETDDGEIDG
ncbi:PcfB family protein [Acutalibacter sp. 1XD8-33]|uniref:DUF3801 domain-containing protein n=1 Tax=Acutalibacter sp. 1XD8-33 TaxID=2320081 RepID=UPI000EA19D9B|nr:DUF3801 domain-containing protein [Acutalibacter sp. 1XD8-33]RKJ40128.1 PcfB family protein [Acutalibacter sp. 1XD8-33]